MLYFLFLFFFKTETRHVHFVFEHGRVSWAEMPKTLGTSVCVTVRGFCVITRPWIIATWPCLVVALNYFFFKAETNPIALKNKLPKKKLKKQKKLTWVASQKCLFNVVSLTVHAHLTDCQVWSQQSPFESLPHQCMVSVFDRSP